MQSVKLLVRQVGISNPEASIISEPELNEYIDYQLTSQGYELFSTHYLSDVKDGNGVVQGYKFALWFVKKDKPISVTQDPKTAEVEATKSAKVKI